ncbi:MAG: hypothetical protein NT026_01470 [Candidatus Staskawiczbacteria bacterium]|nr:hypothetical protein [Candidatus Staskawiczbacteria bacterium]
MYENKQDKLTEGKTNETGDKKSHRDLLKWIIIGIVIFVYSFGVFGTGVFVGGMKARFSYRWAENYHRNFGGPGNGFMFDEKMPPPNNEFIEGHGTFGQIIKIGDSDLVIKGQDNVEKVVVFAKDITITIGRRTITKTDLKIGEQVVVIGSPNEQGQIEAKLIRIFDGNIMMGPMMNI